MKQLAIAAAVLGMLGVVLGAFGAHGLKAVVSAGRLEAWETAVSYQMYHAPVLLLAAAANARLASRLLSVAAGCLLGGVLIFSGTLYLLVWFDLPVLGMITPVGGTLLIVGWMLLAIVLARHWSSVAGES